MMNPKNTLSIQNVSKYFLGFAALSELSINIESKGLHFILGENGAGKTTLLKIIVGLLKPDSGTILVNDSVLNNNFSEISKNFGIHMIHQESNLFEHLSVKDNFTLFNLNFDDIVNTDQDIKTIINKVFTRLNVSSMKNTLIRDISHANRQRLEILIAIAMRTPILILDEPTSTLAPDEGCELLTYLKSESDSGKIIVIVTHKIEEAIKYGKVITVIRGGRVVSEQQACNASIEILAGLMMGKPFVRRRRKKVREPGPVIIKVKDMSLYNKDMFSLLTLVSFEMREGEILGVVGTAGSGQEQLAEIIANFRVPSSGTIEYVNIDKNTLNTNIGYIPPDRINVGSIGSMTIKENLLMGIIDNYKRKSSIFLKRNAIDLFYDNRIKKYNIRVSRGDDKVSTLSGGNIQRMILSRELFRIPKILIAVYPTRGLDIESAAFVRNEVLNCAKHGASILLVSQDLDEIYDLSDKILVLRDGNVVLKGETPSYSKNEIALAMFLQ